MKNEYKSAIVTGSSKGIGLAICELLLKEGFKVVGWSRSGSELKHDNYFDISCDMSDRKRVEKAYAKSTELLGEAAAVLINNAGFGLAGKVEEMEVSDWENMFAVNVHGLFYSSRLAVPDMKKRGFGHIINISSIAGTTGIEQMSAYVGTKHAVRGISHSWYKELRQDGIKVSCVYPGSVNTNFFDEIAAVTANENMMRAEDIAESVWHCLNTHENYHVVDIEVRPLRPKGK
ncbi:MAG: SDR family oxidoreductase [Cyclobacteriaceae bacterium]|nr:SDR family oxidoreductase [Cyclobacteriaceae bacterium]MCH8515734.1 SDR family oxidoreductase [Cyclobacteriaceae bacterium]